MAAASNSRKEGGETGKGGQCPSEPGLLAADGKAELAGGGARQQLAEGQQLGEFGLGQPSRSTKVRWK